MFLTQPALSRSIRALEGELGQPLFDRIGRTSELTPFGREAVERARELVLAADDLRDSGHLAADGRARHAAHRHGIGPGRDADDTAAAEDGQEPAAPARGSGAGRHRCCWCRAARAHGSTRWSSTRARLRPGAGPGRAGAARDARRLHGAPRSPADAPAWRGGTSTALLHYPIASTPLSDEVARVLVERYGPERPPGHLRDVALRGTASLVDVARRATPCCWRSARPRPTWSS
jgi:hypothetical protein